MANPTHLERLNQGTNAWNQWREENPEVQPDLSDADLRDSYFSGINLSYTNLDRCLLKAAYLKASNLRGASLQKADLSNANLHQAQLEQANLEGASLIQTKLKYANLTHANLKDVQALGANFTSACLTGACIDNWLINRTTKFEWVACAYVCRGSNLSKHRYPADEDFPHGEFAKLFGHARNALADEKTQPSVDWLFEEAS